MSETADLTVIVHSIRIPNEGYTIRTEQHQGKTFIVVPVVMMVEGVHNGSDGPVLHTAAELGAFAHTWNGMPVTVDHPQEGENFVSANTPEMIDSRAVGRIYHSEMKGVKLTAEAWLDEEKLRNISPVALAAIQAGDPLDVSIGVFTENEDAEGTYINTNSGEEETYTQIAHNHRPDHLALLPGGTGACSWSDGCGVRANKEGGKNLNTNDEMFMALKELKSTGIPMLTIGTIGNYAKSFNEIMNLVYSKINSMDTETVVYYLQDVYDEFLVYEARMRNTGSAKMYKQNYAVADGVIDFTGDPVEVEKKTSYVAINAAMVRTKFNNNSKKEVNKMGEIQTCSDCVKKKVDALIANSQGKYTEADREQLETLSEAVLDKISVPVIKEVEKKVEVNVLSDEQAADLAAYRKQRKAEREKKIAQIQDNTSKEIWPDAVLSAMNDDHLDRLLSSVKKEEEEVVDYSLATGRKFSVGQEEIEPMTLAGVTLK